ncbi:DUF1573 domain-containing protein [Marinilabiliaceae bacterium ANBcel2]|nr:DUF1573 domain-containing protein [Marinilabiliaceae bacterium ANBcel2]
MRKNIFFGTFLLLLSFLFMGAGEVNGPVLEFEKSGLQLGEIELGDLPDNNFSLVFTNEGTQPLVLSNVRACCGTRVLSYPEEPVMPGYKDTIKVRVNFPRRAQRFNRVVTVNSNCENDFSHTFRISGRVVENGED